MAILRKRWRTCLLSLLAILLVCSTVVGQVPGTAGWPGSTASAVAATTAIPGISAAFGTNCYGPTDAGDDPTGNYAIREQAKLNGFLSNDSDCSSWSLAGYYYQIGGGTYAYFPLQLNLNTLTDEMNKRICTQPDGSVDSACMANRAGIVYRVVLHSPVNGMRPFQDKGTDVSNRYWGPGLAEGIPPGDPNPDVIVREAALGLPEALPIPFAWAGPFPAPSECPNPYSQSMNAACYKWVLGKDTKMVARPPDPILDPQDSNNPLVRFTPAPMPPAPSPQWLDTGRTQVTTGSQTPPPQAPNIPPDANCDPTGTLPCFRWTLRASYPVGTNPGEPAYLSQANVVRARQVDPNKPVLFYTVRGFFYDPATYQLVEFEKQHVPSQQDNLDKADLSFLFVTTIKADDPNLRHRTDLPVLQQLFPDGFHPPTLRRMNIGGRGTESGERGASPPPSNAPPEAIVEWSRQNQAPITTHFDVRVSGNTATVDLGVARPNKRPMPVYADDLNKPLLDPATGQQMKDPVTGKLLYEQKIVGGHIDTDITKGIGAGDISVSDKTTFRISR